MFVTFFLPLITIAIYGGRKPQMQLVQTLSLGVLLLTGLVSSKPEGLCPDGSFSPFAFCNQAKINKQFN